MNKFQKVTSIFGVSAISNGIFFSTAKFLKKQSDPIDNEISPIAFIFSTAITSGAAIGLSLLENLINEGITNNTYLKYGLEAAEVLGIFNITGDLLLSFTCKDGFVGHFKHGITANFLMPSLSQHSIVAKALNINALGQVLAATYIWGLDESSDDWNFFSNHDADAHTHSEIHSEVL